MWDEILDEIAEQSQRSRSLPEPTQKLLCEVWPTLAGEALATISRPLRLEDGVLTMEVRERPLINEWKASPQILLRRLRRFCPWKIERLQFRHNPRLQPPTAPGRTLPMESDPSPLSDSRSTVDATTGSDTSKSHDIDDPELQALIDSINRHRTRNRDDNT